MKVKFNVKKYERKKRTFNINQSYHFLRSYHKNLNTMRPCTTRTSPCFLLSHIHTLLPIAHSTSANLAIFSSTNAAAPHLRAVRAHPIPSSWPVSTSLPNCQLIPQVSVSLTFHTIKVSFQCLLCTRQGDRHRNFREDFS